MAAKNTGGWKTCSRGHKFRGAAPCPICYPGSRKRRANSNVFEVSEQGLAAPASKFDPPLWLAETLTPNNALERTVKQRGAPLGREAAACAAAQLGR